MSQDSLKTILDTVQRKAQSYEACGMPFPDWLVAECRAVILMGDNYIRGLVALTDALQDETAALKNAEYIPYEMGKPYGQDSPDL